MLDRDLAELYGVETKYLKRQVKRNLLRFPPDFMFELTETELQHWRRQFGTSNSDKMGLRYLPLAEGSKLFKMVPRGFTWFCEW
jgi:hypothetical protein